MITIPLKPIIVLAALLALLWVGGAALAQLALALLAMHEVRIALFSFVAGAAAAYTIGWNGAIEYRRRSAIEKADKEAAADRRKLL